MSIHVYVGMPGSGKSYNAVAQQIIPALKEGRTVVTNIPLHLDALRAEHPHGKIVEFPLDAVMQNPHTIREYVTPGCLFVLDEVWRIWPAGDKANKIPEAYKSLLAEHRHMVGTVRNPQTGKEVKVSCQIVLIVQDAGNMAAFARKLTEQTFVHTKLGHVGSANSFRCDMFHGPVTGTVVSPGGANFIRSTFGRYSEDVWKFYKSHTMSEAVSDGASEKAVDRRGSALKRPIFVLMPLVLIGGIWAIMHVKSDVMAWGKPKEQPVSAKASPQTVEASKTVIGSQTAAPHGFFAGISPGSSAPKVTFRVVGYIGIDSKPDSKVAVLSDGKHLVKRTMDHCRTVDTDFMECEVAGTYYSQFGGSIADNSGDKAVPVAAPQSATPKNLPLGYPSAASLPAVGGPAISQDVQIDGQPGEEYRRGHPKPHESLVAGR